MFIKFKENANVNIKKNTFFDIPSYQNGGTVGESKNQGGGQGIAQKLKPTIFESAATTVKGSLFDNFIKTINSSKKTQKLSIPGFENTFLFKQQKQTEEEDSSKEDINEKDVTSGEPNPESYEWLISKKGNKNVVINKTPEQLWRKNYKEDRTLTPDGRTDWTKEEFVKALNDGYKSIGIKSDAMINYLIAQDVLESDWGKKGASVYNNFGNINAGAFADNVALRFQKSEKDGKYHLVYYCAPKNVEEYCNLKVNKLFKLPRYVNKGIDVYNMKAKDLIPKLLEAGYCENNYSGSVHENYIDNCNKLAAQINNLRKKIGCI